MAGEDVPAKFVADRERALEIDPRPCAPIRERAPLQRLGGGLNLEPPLARLGRRQADAGAGDRGADRDRARVIGGLDGKDRVAARHHRAHTPDIADDPGEHRRKTLELSPGAVTRAGGKTTGSCGARAGRGHFGAGRQGVMKITAIDSMLLRIPYRHSGPPTGFGGKVWTTLDTLLVRVDTDEGVTGWGEAFGYNVNEGTKATIDTLIAPLCIGRDAAAIGALMADLQRKLHLFGRGGPVTYGLSGVDIALWDIAGKCAGLPLHR